jgi:hypothetical protein
VLAVNSQSEFFKPEKASEKPEQLSNMSWWKTIFLLSFKLMTFKSSLDCETSDFSLLTLSNLPFLATTGRCSFSSTLSSVLSFFTTGRCSFSCTLSSVLSFFTTGRCSFSSTLSSALPFLATTGRFSSTLSSTMLNPSLLKIWLMKYMVVFYLIQLP